MSLKYLCNYIVLINIVYRDRCDEVVVVVIVWSMLPYIDTWYMLSVTCASTFMCPGTTP